MTTLNVFQNTVQVNPILANSGNNVSGKYQHCNSMDIIEQVSKQGFELVSTSYGTPRKAEKKGFQKHIMIFEHQSKGLIDDDNKMQLLVTNSHDGSSSLRFNIGVFRTICANGLVVGDNFLESRIRHIGKGFLDQLDHETNETLKNFDIVAETVRRMQGMELNGYQKAEFAREVARARLRQVQNVQYVNLNDVVKVRRHGDQSEDFYTLFNRAQEAAIRGGIGYRTSKVDEQGKTFLRNNTTKEIKSISTKLELNKELWNIAQGMVA